MRRSRTRIISVICALTLTMGSNGGMVYAQGEDASAEVFQESSVEETMEVSTEDVIESAEESKATDDEDENAVSTEESTEDFEMAEKNPSIFYSVYVQNEGWQDEKTNNETAGTMGRCIEAVKLRIADSPLDSGNLTYRVHLSDLGWQDWVMNDTVSETEGKGHVIEAMQVQLSDALSEQYDIYYRVYNSDFGWLGWAKNGERAGTTGRRCGVEAIEFSLVKKGEAAPGTTDGHYKPTAWELDYKQVGESTSVKIIPGALKEIIQEQEAVSLSVTARMIYNGQVTKSVTIEKDLKEIDESGFEIDFENYGKFQVEASFIKDGKIVGIDKQEVGVSASEYNLAPLSATFPVVLFSLSLWDINRSESGNSIPTIVMLDRPSAYDWESLPEGVYGLPYLAKSNTYDYTAFTAYVKSLYEISPNAKFNLYLNDITCSYVHHMIYANQIPEGQYTITLISDGSASYNIFNDTYDVINPEEKHQELVDVWNEAKQYSYETGKVSSGWNWHQHWECMYAVLTCEPEAEWWVARNNLFTSGDGNVFAERAKADVTRKNVSSMLLNLQDKGEETVQEFKALYDFNDGYFEKADVLGKKAMMLLGTYVYNENSFEDYARLTQLYYGDDYVYYYKGHPNTPTGMYPEKQKQLENLDMIDVDSSIAAELILFFNPEISLSGYGTSTFNSASEEMACGLFNTTKETALAAGSSVDYSGIDWFVSPINKNNVDAGIKKLCDTNDTYYMVEFSDSILESEEYHFAIFNATQNVLIYYKDNGEGEYEVVRILDNGNKLKYRAHVSDIGWQDYVADNELAGTTGKAKAIEAMEISLLNTGYSGNIEYRAYVAQSGWQDWKKNGEIMGTTGKSLSMEALSIRLTGEMAEQYDIYYRVHAKDFGWLGWAKNGATAGTIDYAARLEAVEIQLVSKGGMAPGTTENSCVQKKGVFYRTHIQDYGWVDWTENGQASGTEAQSRRLEGLQIKLVNSEVSGDISYRTHVQDYGWMDWTENGQVSGTEGESRRLEAVQIRLKGDIEKSYDIHYRVHVQDYGWMDWVKNGQTAGTEGESRRMEAIEIKLVKKSGD